MNGQRRVWTVLSLAAICCVCVPLAAAQHLTEQWVEDAAGRLIENQVVDGLSVGYLEGKDWGVVHLGSSTRVGKNADSATLYELGSVSKVFTSLLLADAAARGEIDLNATAEVANGAKIRLPSRDGKSITWTDLSTHRSGLPRLADNLTPAEVTNPYRDYDSKLAAAFLNQYELPRPPGEAQEYSNLAVSVLGYLVAENAGKSYQQLLRERIAKPLRMTDCTVILSKDQQQRLAVPHASVGSPTPPWTFADLPGAGGVHASMQDMMRFAKAQLNPPAGPIGEAIELAWKQHREADASGQAMGLGWLVAGDGQTRLHNGRTGGSTSALFINRELNCAVIVLSNTSVSDGIDQLAMQMVMKAAGQDVEPGLDGTFAKKSPFTAVRWNAEQPEVKIGDTWYKLVSLNDLPATEIVAFSRETFATIWQKRFEEDLVEVLSRMGSPPGDTVKLVVESLSSGETQVLQDTPMTEANRQAVVAAARARAKNEPSPNETAGPDSDNLAVDAKLRSRLVGRYQIVPEFILTVTDKGGRMTVQATNQPALEILPDSPTRWTCREVDATIEFKLAKTGPAKSLILHQNGIQQTARRLKQEPGETLDHDADELAIDAKLRGRLEGRYQLTPNFIFDVNDRDGRLMVGITNQPTQEVFPDSPTRWSYRGVDATLEFKLPKTGPAKSLILHQNGIEQTARRIK